ncbi:MAG: hypothetical protein M1820_006457 [Bogoriella megaspora]|nr:MAG: hypothetical protein M1820_006457 [Bogoriella megaspora]
MAPPLVLADLIHTCNNIWMTDAWAFDMPLKILQLRIDLPSKASASPKNVMDYENTPFFTHVRNMRFGGTQYCRSIVHTRPWTHVSVNEGSSLKAYSTYEYFHKKPPTVAPSLLSCFLAPGSQVLTHLSYVAIFPFRDHLQWFRRYLLPCNTIRSFCVQLAPLPASKLTDDPERLGKAQLGDCWLELERGYKDLCALIVSMDETSDLTNFESLDYENYELVQEDLRQAFAPLDAYGWHMVRGGLWRKTDSA